ncbi:MAG: helix-turn-helix transcriptional regulator [Acidobacteria bacterium]|nr:helix-turn-helix transcriptional regulator [Acidobacteriota bacterium]
MFSSRQRRGLSQGTVSRLAGIHPSYLSRIETGKVHPTVRTAVRIATALQISLDELLGPSPASSADKPCPISPNGRCFIDLIESRARKTNKPGAYTPKQLRILRKLATLVANGSPRLLNASESLSDEMNGSMRARKDRMSSKDSDS